MAARLRVISGAFNPPEVQRGVTGFIRRPSSRSRAIALLLFCALVFSGCASQVTSGEGGDSAKQSAVTSSGESTKEAKKVSPEPEKTEPPAKKEDTSEEAQKIREAQESLEVKNGDAKDIPEFKKWNDESGNSKPIQLNTGGSAGAIPAVKPFNFGRDPGGPEDKTLYLSVPKIGLEDVPVYNSTSEEALTKSAIHVPATGFPWQKGANTYIAGHRLGYPGTGSYEIFFDLNLLAAGDEITVTDAAGGRYVYSVTEQKVVDPKNVEVMNPVEGESVISLQTCTLPDYTRRIVVQGELVESPA